MLGGVLILMKLYFQGKPKRKYLNDEGSFRCPKCKGRFDKATYGSDTCKKCGVILKQCKTYFITQSGKPEMVN